MLRTAWACCISATVWSSHLPAGPVDLIERAALSAKCVFCAFCQPPNASSIVKSLHLRERAAYFAATCVIARPVVVLRDDLLRLGRVEKLAGTPRATARVPFLSTTLSTIATGGSARMLIDGTTISTWPLRLGQRQIRLVLPGEQHVADAALHERRRRAARAGVEHRHVPVQRRDELPRLGVVAARLPLRVLPGRQVVPARAARRLRDSGVITATPGLTRSLQSLMPFGLPLRTRNTIVDVYGELFCGKRFCQPAC